MRPRLATIHDRALDVGRQEGQLDQLALIGVRDASTVSEVISSGKRRQAVGPQDVVGSAQGVDQSPIGLCAPAPMRFGQPHATAAGFRPGGGHDEDHAIGRGLKAVVWVDTVSPVTAIDARNSRATAPGCTCTLRS